MSNNPIINPNIVANPFRVYDYNLLNDPDFMLGWRMWSFHITKVGEPHKTAVWVNDTTLIHKMKKIGKECGISSKENWNNFRTSILQLFPDVDSSLHYHDQYRIIFQKVAFVIVDCCFAIKFKFNSKSIHKLLTKLFKATNTNEIPEYFIILNNHIMNSELDHKLRQCNLEKYENTQDNIKLYREYNPNLKKHKIQKSYIPITMSHFALLKSETKAQKNTNHMILNNRARINDFAHLFLIDYIRKSFGRCARVALLSDDNMMIRGASTFRAPKSVDKIYPDLPFDYSYPYIVTTALLPEDELRNWKNSNAY